MSEQRDSDKQELGFLERLSIEDLEALLKTSGNPNDVEAFFDAVIKEVVKREKKEPTGRLPDVDTVWEDLQAHCEVLKETVSSSGSADNLNMAECRVDLTPPKKGSNHKSGRGFFRSATKIAAIVVLTLLLSFSVMIGAQAMGIDMFGALARWTSDTFHFETQQTVHNSQNDLHDSVQAMLNAQGILGEYAPRWYPEGSKIIKYSLQNDEFGLDTYASFMTADERDFYIRVRTYNDIGYVDSAISERDSDFSEKYPSHGKVFYIFNNKEYIKGTWSDGKIVLSIRGNLTVEEIKAIIDSIGG